MIWLSNFPLPPSVNSYLSPVARRSRNGKLCGRLIKTVSHRKYQNECIVWSYKNREFVKSISHELNSVKTENESQNIPFTLRVDCFFVLHSDRIFTANNKVKQIDANNRLKPVLDGLVTVIGIDDKHYFAGNCEKVSTASKELECAMIKISVMTPRTLEDVKQLMISSE